MLSTTTKITGETYRFLNACSIRVIALRIPGNLALQDKREGRIC